jgi:hypothetical protein
MEDDEDGNPSEFFNAYMRGRKSLEEEAGLRVLTERNWAGPFAVLQKLIGEEWRDEQVSASKDTGINITVVTEAELEELAAKAKKLAHELIGQPTS